MFLYANELSLQTMLTPPLLSSCLYHRAMLQLHTCIVMKTTQCVGVLLLHDHVVTSSFELTAAAVTMKHQILLSLLVMSLPACSYKNRNTPDM